MKVNTCAAALPVAIVGGFTVLRQGFKIAHLAFGRVPSQDNSRRWGGRAAAGFGNGGVLRRCCVVSESMCHLDVAHIRSSARSCATIFARLTST